MKQKESVNVVRFLMEFVVRVFDYIIGGGKLKYRVIGCRVEMKGGGTGLFWGPAHFSDFDTPEQAAIFAKKWATKEGGDLVR